VSQVLSDYIEVCLHPPVAQPRHFADFAALGQRETPTERTSAEGKKRVVEDCRRIGIEPASTSREHHFPSLGGNRIGEIADDPPVQVHVPADVTLPELVKLAYGENALEQVWHSHL
jgi:hypothetical protein